jgi:hypothetical protein
VLQKVNKEEQIAIQMVVVSGLIIMTFSAMIETKKMSGKLGKKRRKKDEKKNQTDKSINIMLTDDMIGLKGLKLPIST